MIQKRGSRFLVIGVLAFGLLTASCGRNTTTEIIVIVTATPAATIQVQPTERPTVQPTEAPVTGDVACDKQSALAYSTTMGPLLREYAALFTSMSKGTTTIRDGLEMVKEFQASIAATETPECMSLVQSHLVTSMALSRLALETMLNGDSDTGIKLLQQSAVEMNSATAEINRLTAEINGE